MIDDHDGDLFHGEASQAARSRYEGLSRRAAMGSVAGLALVSSSSSRSKPANLDRVGSVTPQADLCGIVRPEHYGAIGDGVADDTAALQAAFSTGRSIALTSGMTYLITSALRLSADDVTITGGGRIKVSPRFDLSSDQDSNGTHMRALFVTGSNATINGVSFDATDAPVGSAVENGFIWSQAPFTTVRDCLFLGNRKGTCISGLGNAPYMSVQGCRFQSCSGAVLAKGRNTIISGNIVIDATDAAIAINGQSCVGAVIADNTISNEKLTPIPSMIAVEESAGRWTISGNTLIGVNGGGIVCTNILDFSIVKAGVITNNVIDAHSFDGRLPNNKNPGAMIAISSSYMAWIVSDNIIISCPRGNSNSRLIIAAATGGMLHNNIFDARAVNGISAIIEISSGLEGVIIENNKSYAPLEGRHYLFGPGKYNMPCQFRGGWIIGGREGINCETHVNSISGINVGITSIAEVSCIVVINAFTILGDRCNFLNAGAWARVHQVGRYTEMYATELPKNAGATPFQIGDRFHFMNPDGASGTGVVRTAKGWLRA